MDELLPAATFLRIHKSYIVNIDHIDHREKGTIVITKECLPVGESFKKPAGSTWAGQIVPVIS